MEEKYTLDCIPLSYPPLQNMGCDGDHDLLFSGKRRGATGFSREMGLRRSRFPGLQKRETGGTRPRNCSGRQEVAADRRRRTR